MTKFLLIFMLASLPAMAQKVSIVEPVKFLALGDSYTIGESVLVKDRWPVQLIAALRKQGIEGADATIIATTGWRTDDLQSAIASANLKPGYSLVSLLIGVNNYYQGKSVEDYAPEFRALLTTAITLAGGLKTRVFVVSIPDYGYTPFGKSNQPTISAGIDAFNAANRSIAEEMGVTYVYITDISRRGLTEPELVAPDGLHPSGKMYTEWVNLILENANIVPAADEGDGDDGDTVTGIEGEKYGVRVHPNPFENSITIENLAAGNTLLQLINAQGQVIRQQSLATGATTLSTESLAPGPYVLSLREGEREVWYTRLIKR